MDRWWQVVQCLRKRNIPRWESFQEKVAWELFFQHLMNISLCNSLTLKDALKFYLELLEELELAILVIRVNQA